MDLVLASHNQGKLKEIKELFKDFNLNITLASDYGLVEPEETGTTFEENARLKAKYASEHTGKLAISDDSGLEVAAIGGAPGVYTADWAETPNGRDFNLAMEKLRLALQDKQPPFRANFTSVLCLAWPDGRDEVYRGEVHGVVEFPPRGEMGFGYDPVFVPDGYSLAFAELEPSLKLELSHRSRAFEKLMESNPFDI